MSSLSVLMTGNKLAHSTCLKLAGTLMSIWTVGLYIFWYLLIPPKETESRVKEVRDRAANGGSDSSHAVSKGWEEKVLSGDDDRRLPTTIVTGFLVRTK